MLDTFGLRKALNYHRLASGFGLSKWHGIGVGRVAIYLRYQRVPTEKMVPNGTAYQGAKHAMEWNHPQHQKPTIQILFVSFCYVAFIIILFC